MFLFFLDGTGSIWLEISDSHTHIEMEAEIAFVIFLASL